MNFVSSDNESLLIGHEQGTQAVGLEETRGMHVSRREEMQRRREVRRPSKFREKVKSSQGRYCLQENRSTILFRQRR